MSALEKAIELCGGLTGLADQLGITPQAVHKWRKKGRVPIDQVVGVERATGGRVLRQELMPELYADMTSPPAR